MTGGEINPRAGLVCSYSCFAYGLLRIKMHEAEKLLGRFEGWLIGQFPFCRPASRGVDCERKQQPRQCRSNMFAHKNLLGLSKLAARFPMVERFHQPGGASTSPGTFSRSGFQFFAKRNRRPTYVGDFSK